MPCSKLKNARRCFFFNFFSFSFFSSNVSMVLRTVVALLVLLSVVAASPLLRSSLKTSAPHRNASLRSTPPAGCDAVVFDAWGSPQADAVGTATMGATFSLSSASTVSGASFSMWVYGTVSVSLWSTGGTLLATTSYYVSSSQTWVTASFAQPVPVNAGTYVISVASSGSATYGVSYYNSHYFPVSSIATTFSLLSNSNCKSLSNCFPSSPNTAGTVLALTPVVCSGKACSAYSSCTSCAGNACAWCQDSFYPVCQMPSATCRTQIMQPSSCPPTTCTNIANCADCATDYNCVWCLSTRSCQFFSNTTCTTRVGNPKYCPKQKM